MLRPGDVVIGEHMGPVRVEEELGSGGQGVVFRGATESGDPLAVKWYLPSMQTEDLRVRISELSKRPPPSKHFLWPKDLVTWDGEFGYVMGLRPDSYANIPRLLKRAVTPRFPELIRIAIRTVSAFRALQANGLFYCDISGGNLFFDPASGDVLICDNDNVGTLENKSPVLGTPRYMAPEIVRGEAYPSAQTDTFSMGILLFLLLFNDHPLQGAHEAAIRSFDPPAMRKLYGTEPLFIFDPADDSNRPVPGIHDNALLFWEIYPEPLKRVFTQAFTDGLHDPSSRPSFGEWQSALSQTEDSIVQCECGKLSFLLQPGEEVRCWACGSAVDSPPRLELDNGRSVVLREDLKLFRHQMDRRITDNGERTVVVSEVAKHPTAEVLGLKNLGDAMWWITTSDGENREVDPGRAVTVKSGVAIDFGEMSGRIVG